jgi:hypothetical protein
MMVVCILKRTLPTLSNRRRRRILLADFDVDQIVKAEGAVRLSETKRILWRRAEIDVRFAFALGARPVPQVHQHIDSQKRQNSMAVHRKVLEWQAANPTITWIFWIIVWAIVFYILFKPSLAGGG